MMAHPAAPSLTRSVASAIVDACAALGHTVDLVDLVAEGFDRYCQSNANSSLHDAPRPRLASDQLASACH
ncbi:hypothetical protein [Sphingomonas yunnanensis]|uniref:hypothetical protein n=1 Tax=Sphingomonas yunnanensis TaxID=310400 RepID=UPI003CCEBE9C